eukprot:Gregarina_sp_Pseudo_9__2538@NODE_280_length_3303_cov_11_399816_g262_i0_p1_GENE_NODE_280_length_3303_cov_11_399816_g262_i0NODE_280_length_3303_cov_11_399816_g262_i0_p1_ORF_typecomplete_len706_score178_53MAD/PF05557_13/1e03MAD/PF05557_13/1_9e08MAD/PF05557_13/80KASH_CCD/PF14662_6/8_4e02KASH_CCD/PF14662_6/1_2e05KASH_CCD/PF14662_6/18KASH_CCD/PF14662_6/3_1e03Myosin_tail_1/PF01576_19/3e02Myosin_tail_1/PF01576_19/0_0027Myosin_tail_1/PF01576_19/0_00012Myosin_tail_1/PF01576_19/24ATG16/PF08614_11/1_3e03ATG
MQDPAELKRQLENMERELYRVHCQRERLSSPRQMVVSSKVRTPVARHLTDDPKSNTLPPLTRDQFIAIQRQARKPPSRQRSPPLPQRPETAAVDHWGFVSDLISHPSSRRPSRPVTRQPSLDETETEPYSTSSAHLPPRGGKVIPRPVPRHQPPSPRRATDRGGPYSRLSPISQIDYCEEEDDDTLLEDSRCSDEDKYDTRPIARRNETDLIHAFEKKLRNEKDHMQSEFDEILGKLQQEKEELKKKREQDRDKYYAREEEFEKAMAENKLETHRANDQLRRAQQDLSTQRVKYEDSARDNERLQRDIARVEAKNTKLQDRATELQATMNGLKSENTELKSRIAELDREIRRLMRDAAAYEAKTEEYMVHMNSTADDHQRLKTEYTQLKDETRKLQLELGNLQMERERDAALLTELRAKLQRLLAEKESVESTHKILEDRVNEAEAKYRLEKSEREKAQRVSLDLSSRHAEAVKQKVRLDELSAENERLIAEIRNLRHENERCTGQLDRARHEQSISENGKLLAEQEAQKLRNEMKEYRIGASVSRSVPKCKKVEDLDLIDNECNPISKRGQMNKEKSPQHRRPFWWHEEAGAAPSPSPSPLRPVAREGPRSEPLDLMPRRKEFDFVKRVTPVPRRINSLEPKAAQQKDSRLELLQAEKNEVERLLSKIPRNPAFRTSEESDTYSRLQKRLESVEQDIEKISIAL